jgi:hypothetical protein
VSPGEDTPTSANPVNPTVELTMRVSHRQQTFVDARSNAEPTDDVVTPDYYALLPQIRLSVDASGRYERADTATEVILDDTDVARLVACAIRHPNRSMRQVVLAAIWNDPQTFREIFEFGLGAPPAFAEIGKIVAAALARHSADAAAPGARDNNVLLPPMPRPAHLKNRRKGQ